MVIKDSTLKALRTMVRGEFQKGFDDAVARDDYKQLVTIITSKTKSNTYDWLGNFPQMREWVGDRVIKNMKEHSYQIQNKKFESTLGVAREDIEDDNLGHYKPLAQSAGQECVDFFWREIAKLMKDGISELCYDGQPFFDTDHPVYENADGSGSHKTVSNIIRGTGSTPPDATLWFVLSLDRPLKPFIQQERMKPEFDEIKSTDNDTVFMKDLYLFGSRYRGNWGYGLWQQAVGSKADLNVKNFEDACTAMETFKRDGGDPMGIRPTHLLVSPANRVAAEAILKKQFLANGESNTNYDRVKLVVCPWL